eukprot:INCI12592.1.p1 GENE.INCI12592.1~~INCI12592.1.p1  ORF type:complete len:194 (+),score=20.69 INCI12592.1:154-735(+)
MNVQRDPRLRSWDKVARLQAGYEQHLVKNAYKTPLERAAKLQELKSAAGPHLLRRIRIGSLNAHSTTQLMVPSSAAPSPRATSLLVPSGRRAGRNNDHGLLLQRRRQSMQVAHSHQRAVESALRRQRRSRKYQQFQQRIPLHQPYQAEFTQRYPEQTQKPHRLQFQKNFSSFGQNPPTGLLAKYKSPFSSTST